MFKYLLKYKWYILIIVALMIIEPTVNSKMNFILQDLFNSVHVSTEKLAVIRLITAGFLLWLFKRVIIFANGLLRSRFICNAKRDIKHEMFLSIMGHSCVSNVDTLPSGEIISNFTNDITMLESRFFEQLIGLASGIFSVVILGSSFFGLNRKLALAVISFGVVSVFVPLVFSKLLNGKSLAYSGQLSRFTESIKEYMVAFRTIKNYSIEDKIAAKFDDANQKTEDAKFETDYMLNLANCVGQLLAWFMQLFGVGLGLIMVINGEILIGTVIAAQMFASDLANPLQNIVFSVNSIRSIKAIVDKLEKLTEGASDVDLGTEADFREFTPANLDGGGSDIDFSDVSLQIGEKSIIDRFSYRFEAGKKYLVVGLNGSGKSSIFRALKKWYPNCTGDITIDGTDIRRIDNERLSRLVSYMNENVSLFSESVKDNITLYRDYGKDVFDKVIGDLQIRLDLDRVISDEGKNISSGEQRRIEIARSLLNEARVLIFDEVVSTLDIETAYVIEQIALNFNKTVIFISHNFSGKLLKKYDDILVICNGTLLDHGKYDELIGRCDYFRKICDIKFGDMVPSDV